MKKLILIVFTLFVGTSVFSQEIDFGIKGGANFSNISDASEFSNKTGFQAGIFAGLKFTDKVGIQADVLYSQQGAKLDYGDFDLDYINVPVVLKYYLIQGLNIQAGPQFGFIVNDDLHEILIGGSKDYVSEKTDVSAVVGAGYDFPFGIRLDARYNFGFRDVSDFDGNNKNNFFSVALGYSFL